MTKADVNNKDRNIRGCPLAVWVLARGALSLRSQRLSRQMPFHAHQIPLFNLLYMKRACYVGLDRTLLLDRSYCLDVEFTESDGGSFRWTQK